MGGVAGEKLLDNEDVRIGEGQQRVEVSDVLLLP